MSKNNQQGIDPQKVKHWITVIIAILSAIAGAIGEASAHIVGAMIG